MTGNAVFSGHNVGCYIISMVFFALALAGVSLYMAIHFAIVGDVLRGMDMSNVSLLSIAAGFYIFIISELILYWRLDDLAGAQ